MELAPVIVIDVDGEEYPLSVDETLRITEMRRAPNPRSPVMDDPSLLRSMRQET
jgi:hypothetical protein